MKALFVGTVLLSILLLAACANQAPLDTTSPTDTSAPQTIKIGVMLPLTGDLATYGQSVKRGMDLAQKDLAPGIQLIYEDTQCSGKLSVSAVNKLVSVDNVPAIIGDFCSSATLPAAPVAEEAHVVLLSAASTSPKVTDAGDYIFRVVPSDALQGAFGANLVLKDGHKRLAMIYSNEEYGLGFSGVLEKEFTAQGGAVVAKETFSTGTIDVATQIEKLKAANPDAIYIISNSVDSSVAILKQIDQHNIDAALYGSEALTSSDIHKAAGQASEGLVISTVSSGSAEFAKRHQEVYGEPPGPFAAQGYDAVKALASAIQVQSTPISGQSIKDQLYRTEFDGASGHIKFDANGDISGNYDVLVVRNGTAVVR